MPCLDTETIQTKSRATKVQAGTGESCKVPFYSSAYGEQVGRDKKWIQAQCLFSADTQAPCPAPQPDDVIDFIPLRLQILTRYLN